MSGNALGFIMDSTIGFLVLVTVIVMGASCFSSRSQEKRKVEDATAEKDQRQAA